MNTPVKRHDPTAQNVWAVVPVKNLADAKQRLRAVLTPAQRNELMRAMFDDVLRALADCDRLAGILLVTRDEEIASRAAQFDVRIHVEPANRGHTDAVTDGMRMLSAENVAGAVTLPADLPLVSPHDIAALIDSHKEFPPAVTIAPARDKLGSNAMLCSPPDVMPFRFGDDSFYPHLRKARELGIEPTIVERRALALDIDTPDDLRAFVAEPSPTRAYRYLSDLGVVNELIAAI